jgi:DNA ligase (NAD+)
MDIFELETKYLKAKELYYNGEPMMSDDEFDDLEKLLKDMDSDVVNMVGTSDRRFKHQHLSPMSSLDKIQANLDGSLPMEQITNWFSKFPTGTVFEASPKYDGMAINLIYRKGTGGVANLERAITRGDKTQGKDATSKLMRKVPLWINSEYDVEVRGEIVIPYKIFDEKYLNHPDENIRKYKNPRNFVAGVVNRDETTEDLLNEVCFMAIEARIHDGDYEYPDETNSFLWAHGFNKKDHHFSSFSFTEETFQTVYDEMKKYRETTSPFQLDGFVVKAPEGIRRELGESGHHPNWAVAIKFPPKEAITRVTGLKYRVGTTGEIIPGIELEGVDLDGSTIRNTAGFNMGYIIKEGLFPGAKVAIVKSGDIIPIVARVIEPQFEGEIPKMCPCGKGPAVLEGIHLLCGAEECEVKTLKRFINGVGIYRMDKFGGVTRRLMYEAGFTQISQVFNRDLFNKESLIASGKFKAGKTLDSLFEEMEKLTKVTLAQIILSLGFDGVGSTAAKQLARFIRNKEYNFSGLEKAALLGFNEGESKRIRVEELVGVFTKRGITVEEDIIVKDGIGYEMTGSPKGSGFTVKSELEKFLLSHGYVHTGLKEAKILLTDSINSSSSKMAQARKLGVEIIEYSTLIEKLKENE